VPSTVRGICIPETWALCIDEHRFRVSTIRDGAGGWVCIIHEMEHRRWDLGHFLGRKLIGKPCDLVMRQTHPDAMVV
jgi:hypothetical protein